MEHHVCKGTCGAVSEHPRACAAEGCTHQGQTFEECSCGDMASHNKEGDDTDDKENEDDGGIM